MHCENANKEDYGPDGRPLTEKGGDLFGYSDLYSGDNGGQAEALMSGKDQVVVGWMNKARVAISHILPDPVVAASVRSDMIPKEQAEQEEKKTALFMVLGALVVGALLFLTRNNSSAVPLSSYDKMKYRYKARKAEHKAKDALASVGDAVKGAYHHAKAAVGDAVV